MGAAIAFLLRNPKLVVVAVMVAALAGAGSYVLYLRGQVAMAQAQASRAEYVAQANAETVRSLQDELQRRERIAEQLHAWQQATRHNYGQLRNDIQQQIEKSSAAFRACLGMRVGSGLLERLRRGAAGADDADRTAD